MSDVWALFVRCDPLNVFCFFLSGINRFYDNVQMMLGYRPSRYMWICWVVPVSLLLHGKCLSMVSAFCMVSVFCMVGVLYLVNVFSMVIASIW